MFRLVLTDNFVLSNRVFRKVLSILVSESKQISMLQLISSFNEVNFFLIEFRSSRPEMFCRKGVLKNFAKFTGNHLCQSLFFNKDLRPATLLKKRLWHRCFLVNIAKFLRAPFFTEQLRWLLLRVYVQMTYNYVLGIF